jgi:hypothetical protein
MNDEGKYVVDKSAPRVDRARLMEGPSKADLREIPATTEADWKEADLLIPIDEETWREFELFRAKRRKKAAKG